MPVRPLAATIALCAAFGALGACAAARSAPTRDVRPLVLLVHGRGHQGRDSAEVRREWQQALAVGSRELGGAPALADADVRMVWYADALDGRASDGCGRPSRQRATRRESDADALAGVADVAEALLGAVIETATGQKESGVARGLFGELLFVADPARRCAAERRMGDALDEATREGRPVVVVAHSMGALVAYERLRDGAAAGEKLPPVRLVTVGSFLGHPDAREIVLGGSGGGLLGLPAGVRSWVNVRRDGDPFAHAIGSALAPGARARTRDVRLAEHEGAFGAHDVRSYLRDPATARAVLDAWCQSFAAGAPRACRKLESR